MSLKENVLRDVDTSGYTDVEHASSCDRRSVPASHQRCPRLPDMIPKTETALRLATLFHRKASTPWSEKELKQYKMLYKAGAFNDAQGLKMVEMYYASERKKKEGGIHRRDLMTFLNNFLGELDRARAFAEGLHRSNRGVIDARRRKERPATEAEWQRIAALAKAELERFRASVA